MEIFCLYGFPEVVAQESMKLSAKDKALLFSTTIPLHSVRRIITGLQLAERSVVEAANSRHGRDIGELGSQRDVLSCHYSPVNSAEAPFSFATSKIIN